MSTAIQVEVTADDIAYGSLGNRHSCPIAVALGRALPGVMIIEVFRVYAQWYIDGSLIHVSLPEEATIFVDRFDNGGRDSGTVHPFTFSVTPKELRP